MSQRSIKNSILLLIFIIYTFVYKFFIFKAYMKSSEVISASFLAVFLFFSILFLGYRKDKQTNLSRSVFKVVIFDLFIAFFVMYGLGLVTGFLKNAYSLAFLTALDNILIPIVIIIITEFIRYVFVSANKDKKVFIYLMVFILILFEIFMNVKSLPLNDAKEMFNLCSTIIIPIIVKNIILTYLCYHVGFRSPMLYRFIIDILYVYLMPVVPNLGDYVQCMIRISLPFIIYLNSYSMIDDRIQKPQNIFYKNDLTITDIVVGVILIITICLISGFFPHYIIGIGSDSMTPKINKGDAVIIKKVDKNNLLKKGQIISYEKSGKSVIHRIVKVNKDSYITKGDANGGNDPHPVLKKQVQGVVKFKIPYIAYPTIWLSEFIKRWE